MGVWLAAYYDWSYARAQKRPWLWLFLIFISQFPIYYLMFRLFELEQRLWGIALYVVAVIILVPPFVASRRQLKARQDQEAER